MIGLWYKSGHLNVKIHIVCNMLTTSLINFCNVKALADKKMLLWKHCFFKVFLSVSSKKRFSKSFFWEMNMFSNSVKKECKFDGYASDSHWNKQTPLLKCNYLFQSFPNIKKWESFTIGLHACSPIAIELKINSAKEFPAFPPLQIDTEINVLAHLYVFSLLAAKENKCLV